MQCLINNHYSFTPFLHSCAVADALGTALPVARGNVVMEGKICSLSKVNLQMQCQLVFLVNQMSLHQVLYIWEAVSPIWSLRIKSFELICSPVCYNGRKWDSASLWSSQCFLYQELAFLILGRCLHTLHSEKHHWSSLLTRIRGLKIFPPENHVFKLSVPFLHFL